MDGNVDDSTNSGGSQSDRDDRAVSTSNLPSSPKMNSRSGTSRRNTATPRENIQPKNAFAFMMSGSSKKRKRNRISGFDSPKSRFVPCPVCGRHILPHEMNKHLDDCLIRQGKLSQQLEDEETKCIPSLDSQGSTKEEASSSMKSETTIEGSAMPSDAEVTFPTKSASGFSEEGVATVERNQQAQDIASINAATKVGDKDENEQSNVFAHMMKRSVKVFSENETHTSSQKLYQQMHLDKMGKVSLICYRDNFIIPSQKEVEWSATIQVRGKKDTATPSIELCVTSSIPSFGSSNFYPNNTEPERQRLVQNHSKLSVPVLKSILQKSIRRRKPLPSVRVASELADKSLGDLLRRLPIIILEDSTLHPSFPFLVWIMMAVSKDYRPPLYLLKRVLEIVFEMSSCRWQDSLTLHKRQTTNDDNSNNVDEHTEQNEYLTLGSLHKAKFANRSSDVEENYSPTAILNDDELIVWSILMRGQYGGMACDIEMLQCYAKLWHERFCSIRKLPEDTRGRLSLNGSPGSSTNSTNPGTINPTDAEPKPTSDSVALLEEWNQVPTFIHQAGSKQSSCRIHRLMMTKTSVTPSPSQVSGHTDSNSQMGQSSYYFVGLPCLSKSDMTVEGVDFHCSSVLESTILSNTNLVQECCEELESMGVRRTEHTESQGSWLERVLKSCMWKFSAGVNLRLPLVAAADCADKDKEDAKRLKEFYETRIKPPTRAFGERYVMERLSKRFQ